MFTKLRFIVILLLIFHTLHAKYITELYIDLKTSDPIQDGTIQHPFQDFSRIAKALEDHIPQMIF